MLGQTEVKAQTMLLEMRVAEVEDAVPQLAEHLQEIDDTWGGTPALPRRRRRCIQPEPRCLFSVQASSKGLATTWRR